MDRRLHEQQIYLQNCVAEDADEASSRAIANPATFNAEVSPQQPIQL